MVRIVTFTNNSGRFIVIVISVALTRRNLDGGFVSLYARAATLRCVSLGTALALQRRITVFAASHRAYRAAPRP